MRLRRGGVGLAVSLFAPPLLASAAVGAVAGGVIGEFAGPRVEQDIPGHSDS
jgi:arylsulfatase